MLNTCKSNGKRVFGCVESGGRVSQDQTLKFELARTLWLPNRKYKACRSTISAQTAARISLPLHNVKEQKNHRRMSAPKEPSAQRRSARVICVYARLVKPLFFTNPGRSKYGRSATASATSFMAQMAPYCKWSAKTNPIRRRSGRPHKISAVRSGLTDIDRLHYVSRPT